MAVADDKHVLGSKAKVLQLLCSYITKEIASYYADIWVTV